MKILNTTYRLLRKMGIYKAWSTMEVVELTGKKRSSVLKRLHKLEDAKIISKKLNDERRFYWKVLYTPKRPTAPRLWKESISIYDLNNKHTHVNT